MQEIKFRAWVKTANFGEGIMVYPNDGTDFCMICNGDGFGMVYQNKEWLKDKDFEVMQFTGLKDKNGKEIYEGDIVLANGNTGHMSSAPYGMERKYCTGEKFIVSCLPCGWVLRHISAFNHPSYETPNCIINGWKIIENYDIWNHQGGLEVIGNIYENHELLAV